jgi:hypothetical protein
MRKRYEYRLIRYFQNLSCDEFVNIGIILFDNNKPLIKIADEHILRYLSKAPWIDKDTIIRAVGTYQENIDSLKTDTEKLAWIKSLGNQTISNNFSNNVVSDKKSEDIVEELYNYFLSDKMPVEKVSDIKELKEFFSNKTREKVKSKFSQNLRYFEFNRDFSNAIYNTKSHITYCNLYGSSNDSYLGMQLIKKSLKLSKEHTGSLVQQRSGILCDILPAKSQRSVSDFRDGIKPLRFQYFNMTDEDDIEESLEYMEQGKVI